MRKLIPISLLLMCLACKQDNKQTIIPEPPAKISTSIDGLRTDAVDTLIAQSEELDSLDAIKNNTSPSDSLK